MREFAFDLGPGSRVVGLPARVGAVGAGSGQPLFMTADRDAATGGGGGALRGQWAGGAGRAEPGDPVTVLVPLDRCGEAGWAGHRLLTQVDGEGVLGEPATAVDRRLGLDLRLHARLFQPLQQLALG